MFRKTYIWAWMESLFPFANPIPSSLPFPIGLYPPCPSLPNPIRFLVGIGMDRRLGIILLKTAPHAASFDDRQLVTQHLFVEDSSSRSLF
jgi:hypothetical protein